MSRWIRLLTTATTATTAVTVRGAYMAVSAFILGSCADAEHAVYGAAPVGASTVEAAEPTERNCEQRNPSVEVTADPSAEVAANSSVVYSLTVTNRDDPSCPPTQFLGSGTPPLESPTFRIEPASFRTPELAGGERVTVPVSVTSGAEEEPGSYAVSFFVRTSQTDGSALGSVRASQAVATYRVQEPGGCHVTPSRSLLIRHTSVVEDPVRTSNADGGVWTFGHLLQQLATSAPAPGNDAARVAEALFRSYTLPQLINGFEVAARSGMERRVLTPWPRTSDGKLDLTLAPLRLLAIVHRLDLAEQNPGFAGEGRFVFGVLDRSGASLLFTLIVEYLLQGEPRDWARSVHALEAQVFPSEAYNRALADLTERYVRPDWTAPNPTGAALVRVRSNENALGQDGRWQMRELHWSQGSGLFEPAGLALTPDASWNHSAQLAHFIEQRQDSILTETHTVPARLDAQPFQAGAVFNVLDPWDAPGIASPQARRLFSLNTCDGCHGGETFTAFFHVFPRTPGMPSQLSGFLTGTKVREPATGEERAYGELARRRQLLERIVCE